jgi:tetratricopeptide (TPR) repeat protein
MKTFEFLFIGTLLLVTVYLCQGQTNPKAAEIQAHKSRAEAALGANDQDAAAREFRAVLSLDPKNTEARTNLGVMEFFHGDCASASNDLRRALIVVPSLDKARALLGICQKRMGDPAARKNLETAFAQLKDAKLRSQVGLELARFYQQVGDFEHTASTIGALVALNPEDPNILYFAQRTYSELADETLNKLAIVAPGSARMQQTIAEHLVNSGDLKSAIPHYRKALKIEPGINGIRYELAEAILESAPSDGGTQTDSEKELLTAQANEGDSAGIECELARIAGLRGDTQSAYDHYTRAFHLDAEDTNAQLGMGRALMTMEKPQEARKYLELAVKSDPLNNEAHYRLGIAYRELQMTEQAQKEMTLFQEIKKTKDQVEVLYRQMNRKPKSGAEDELDRTDN